MVLGFSNDQEVNTLRRKQQSSKITSSSGIEENISVHSIVRAESLKSDIPFSQSMQIIQGFFLQRNLAISSMTDSFHNTFAQWL